MKKAYKQFHYGKGLSKTQFGQKPMKWIPWTYIDTYNADTGTFRSRRKFGFDGWAYKDMDTADEHKNYDHIHDIHNDQRSKKRKPNKSEIQEF